MGNAGGGRSSRQLHESSTRVMRKERLSYKDLLRKLLAGRLLRREERRAAESALGVSDTVEIARRLGELLEAVTDREGLIRLGPRPGDPANLRRYLDPSSGDHWTIDLPGPRAMRRPPPAERPPERTPSPAETPDAPPIDRRPPRIVQPVEEIEVVPAVPRRFHDGSGESLGSLFTSFSPCRTPEDIAEALAPIRAQLLERTSASDARFHFLLETGGDLVPVPFHDQPAAEFVPLGGRVRADVLGNRKTLHVPNLAAHGTDARPEDGGALVTLPLVAGEVIAGLLEIRRDRPGPFEPDELQFFSMAAFVAAGIVVRADVLEKLIFLDKLTGLYNRAYFDDQLEREIERANRMGTSVALSMADLDHFKRINDTYGHQAGDHALTHLASIIRANTRSIDVAARYGGEEFAILLPSITRSQADLAGERLRRVVSEAKLGDVVPALRDVRMTISVGIALYPDDAATAKQLIDRADRVALYAAKNWGRNRVVSWATARDANEKLKRTR